MAARNLTSRDVTVRAWVAAAGVVLLVVVSFWVGLRSTWGTKHPQTLQGVAVRANDENGLALFDADDGTQAGFDADSVSWAADGTSGDGDPPCLTKPLARAKVEVGLLKVAGPGGGSGTHVVWVRCL